MENCSNWWLRRIGLMSERLVEFSSSSWMQSSTCIGLESLTATLSHRISCSILTTTSNWSISVCPITRKRVSTCTPLVEALAMLRLRWCRAGATRVKSVTCGRWALSSMAWFAEICLSRRTRLNSCTKEWSKECILSPAISHYKLQRPYVKCWSRVRLNV